MAGAMFDQIYLSENLGSLHYESQLDFEGNRTTLGFQCPLKKQNLSPCFGPNQMSFFFLTQKSLKNLKSYISNCSNLCQKSHLKLLSL